MTNNSDLSQPRAGRTVRRVALGICAIVMMGAQTCSTTNTPGQSAPQPTVRQSTPQLTPAEITAEKRRAKSFIEQSQYARAIPVLDAVVRSAPNDVDALELLGLANHRSGRLGKAEKSYFRAYQAAPAGRKADIAIPLGRVYMELNQYGVASSFLEEAVSKHFGDETLYDDLVKIHRKLNANDRWLEVVAMASALRLMKKPRKFPPVAKLRAEGIQQMVKGHFSIAFFELLKAAERGDSESQYLMGRMYHQGLGNHRKNLFRARAWYVKAARQGHKHAQSGVGYMYLRGLGGVRRDEARAAQWFRRAADQNDPGAMARLGLMYEKGTGVRRDTRKASFYLVMAAQAGDRTARRRLTQLRSWPLSGAARRAAKPEIIGGIGELPPLSVMTDTGMVAISDSGAVPSVTEKKAAKKKKPRKRRKKSCPGGLASLGCAF